MIAGMYSDEREQAEGTRRENKQSHQRKQKEHKHANTTDNDSDIDTGIDTDSETDIDIDIDSEPSARTVGAGHPSDLRRAAAVGPNPRPSARRDT